MSNQQANLWWAYDSESQSFSALPASPLLLPALLIMGVIALFRGTQRPYTTIEELAGELRDTPEWQAKYKRYMHLVRVFAEEGMAMDNYEWLEMKSLREYMFNPYRL